MIFNDHSNLEGLHAFLGASKFRWIHYDDEVLEKRFYGQYATTIGTIIHELAKDLINSRSKLSRYDRRLIELELYRANIPRGAYDAQFILENLMPFVNDAIGYHMESEVILYHSYSAFGTADAIGFDERQKILRIHDYKNGLTKAHIEQLLIYAALFCLEYRKNPNDFDIELRIYQNLEISTYIPEADEIEKFMDMIKSRSEYIQNLLARDKR